MNLAPHAAIILAAGSSSRLGQPKQLLRFRGRTLIELAARKALAAGCQPVLAVLGNSAPEVAAALAALPEVALVVNESWAEGMAGSLRAGLSALQIAAPACPGALLLLCDQPLLEVAHLEALLAHAATGRIAASRYPDGALGVPAVFPSTFFPELQRLEGNQGARSLFTRHPALVVAEPLGRMAFDLDTPDDLARLPG